MSINVEEKKYLDREMRGILKGSKYEKKIGSEEIFEKVKMMYGGLLTRMGYVPKNDALEIGVDKNFVPGNNLRLGKLKTFLIEIQNAGYNDAKGMLWWKKETSPLNALLNFAKTDCAIKNAGKSEVDINDIEKSALYFLIDNYSDIVTLAEDDKDKNKIVKFSRLIKNKQSELVKNEFAKVVKK